MWQRPFGECLLPFSSELSSCLLFKTVNKTIITSVGLYEFEILSHTLREQRRLRVLENRVLKRTFGPGMEEVVGGCRNLYSSSNIIRVIKLKRVKMGEARSAHGRDEKLIRNL
jgi:hypothetical protein